MSAPTPSADLPAPLAWEPDGHWVAFGGDAGVQVEWVSPEHAQKQIASLATEGDVCSLSVSRDARWLACGCTNGEVVVWKVDLELSSGWTVTSRREVLEADSPPLATPTLVAFSPVDDSLAVARGERVLLLRLDAKALLAGAAPRPGEPEPVMERVPVSLLSILSGGSEGTFISTSSRGQLSLRQDWGDAAGREQALVELAGRVGKSATREGTAALEGLVRALRDGLVPRGLLASSALADDDAPLALVVADAVADVPWELLLAAPDQVPLAVTRGLVRLVPEPRASSAASPGVALVVACPRSNAAGDDPSLTRSAPEADAVADAIEGAPWVGELRRLRRPGARELLDALRREPIRLLFIAGDGTLGDAYASTPSEQAEASLPGVVLDQGLRLTANEFARMPEMPELVFLSCAYLSRMAPQLLRLGVRVVVAPLWNVEDEAAATFSTTFFDELLRGARLVWATQRARAATYDRHREAAAWAAFQVYGDASYLLQEQVPGPAPAPAPPAESNTIDVDLSNVLLAATDGPASDRVLHAVPGQDLVSLQVAGGPELTVSLESAQSLVAAVPTPAATPSGSSSGTAKGTPAPKGFLGGVMLSAVKLLSGRAESDPAEVLEVARRADAAVDPGVYALSAQALEPLKGSSRKLIWTAAATSEPILVLVHGLMADTASTFGKLWQQHPQLVSALFGRYRSQVFALESATLGLGPIPAALVLVGAMPAGARVHLLTHASGGLVGEILVRCGAGADPSGSEGVDAAEREVLQTIVKEMAAKRLRVERIVRVACPVQGTLLLPNRVDVYMSVVYWARQLVGMDAPAEAGALTLAAARHPDAFRALPGIAAIASDSALIRWLNSAGSVAGELRVIAGDVQGDNVVSWVKTLLVDSFYQGANDLVVPTASMFGGVRRSGTSLFHLDQGRDASHFNYFANPRTAEAAINALLEADPPEFAPIGPQSMAGQSSAGSN